MARFISTKDHSLKVSFKDAVLSGLAPQQGLFLPEQIIPFSKEELHDLVTLSPAQIAYKIARHVVGDEVESAVLEQIVNETVHFTTPLTTLKEGLMILELFHGPSLAFKDFGARFLACYLSSLRNELTKKVVVLTATSGDTGAAVAQAFKDSSACDVYILFPKGKVSPLQQRQITTIGGTVHAIEVDGTFDDCQALVKQGLQDVELASRYHLTAANSINIGRLLPQIFYYFFAYATLVKKELPLYFVVPSGNFGNLCAGIFAQQLGLPVTRFVAATNANDVVPRYLENALFEPRATVATISNAMDVGSPNNFPRIMSLFDNNLEKIRDAIAGYTISDDETLREIKQTYIEDRYILDPHTAVGVCAAKRFSKDHYLTKVESNRIVLGTAHPAKFNEVLEQQCGITTLLPSALSSLLDRPEQYDRIAAQYQELKRVIFTINGK